MSVCLCVRTCVGVHMRACVCWLFTEQCSVSVLRNLNVLIHEYTCGGAWKPVYNLKGIFFPYTFLSDPGVPGVRSMGPVCE